MELDNKQIIKKERFSYSKLSTYDQCSWKYKLIYKDFHFISTPAIATEFGTLIHYVEETMARNIKNYIKLDYPKLIDLFMNADIQEDQEHIYGVNLIKERYPTEFYTKDKSDRTYEEKAKDYINKGIYRLRDYLMANLDFDIVGIEEEFNLEYNGYVFHGFIDRVFKDLNTGHLYIEDIKSYSVEMERKDLTTPLQMVLYSLAAEQLYNTNLENISCIYELPLCNIKQEGGTKGFIKRGIKKLDKLLESIANNDFKPSPSPLCHWCVFSKTYPNQPEEAKNLCPYCSNYTKAVPNFTCDFEWAGIENHAAILEAFINKQNSKENTSRPIYKNTITIEKAINPSNSERRFIIRR